MKNKIIIVITVIIIAIAAAVGWFIYSRTGDKGQNKQLTTLKQAHPNLATYVDQVMNTEGKVKQDNTKIENYFELGLAWKSLAEMSKSAKIENYRDYYQKALNTYEAGIDITQRKNTLFMTNAANMAIYLGDYTKAENYLKEAISVSPGDETYYANLADLYQFQMGKTKDEILAVYDEGLKKVLGTTWLTARKNAYLESIGEKQTK